MSIQLRALIKKVVASGKDSGAPGDRVSVNLNLLDDLAYRAKQLTQEEYVDLRMDCPFCGDNDIIFDDNWCLSGSTVTQGGVCCNCNETWDEEYELTGYEPMGKRFTPKEPPDVSWSTQ